VDVDDAELKELKRKMAEKESARHQKQAMKERLRKMEEEDRAKRRAQQEVEDEKRRNAAVDDFNAKMKWSPANSDAGGSDWKKTKTAGLGGGEKWCPRARVLPGSLPSRERSRTIKTEQEGSHIGTAYDGVDP
jgi:hypothetical protein